MKEKGGKNLERDQCPVGLQDHSFLAAANLSLWEMTKEKNPQKNVLIWKSGATVKTGKNDEKMKWVLVSRNIRFEKAMGSW